MVTNVDRLSASSRVLRDDVANPVDRFVAPLKKKPLIITEMEAVIGSINGYFCFKSNFSTISFSSSHNSLANF